MASYPTYGGDVKARIYVPAGSGANSNNTVSYGAVSSRDDNLARATENCEDFGISFRSAGDSGGTNSDSNLSTGHCHTELDIQRYEVDKIARKKLIIASILCLIFTIGEAVGGIMAGSLAVATDSAHMLTDFASFMISLLAIYLAPRPPTKKLSFGWHRAEIIGALVSVQLIWIVTGILVYMAVQRCINRDYTIQPLTMMVTAACAVLFNVILGLTLHGVGIHGHSHGGSSHQHSHDSTQRLIKNTNDAAVNGEYGYGTSVATNENVESDLGNTRRRSVSSQYKENMNVRAAFIHVVGDLIQSIGVLIASIIIYFRPDWKLADPICTFVFSVLVLISTMNILKDALRVLMEATPRHIDFAEMQETLMEIDGVKYVHNLRIWSLTTTKFTMSVHLAIDDISQCQEVLQEASSLIRRRYHIEDPTIQIEQYTVEMEDCHHCKEPANH